MSVSTRWRRSQRSTPLTDCDYSSLVHHVRIRLYYVLYVLIGDQLVGWQYNRRPLGVTIYIIQLCLEAVPRDRPTAGRHYETTVILSQVIYCLACRACDACVLLSRSRCNRSLQLSLRWRGYRNDWFVLVYSTIGLHNNQSTGCITFCSHFHILIWGIWLK